VRFVAVSTCAIIDFVAPLTLRNKSLDTIAGATSVLGLFEIPQTLYIVEYVVYVLD